MQGGAGLDFVAWVRQQLWQRNVPATVMPAPGGGATIYLETGQIVHFPSPDALTWFLAGFDAGHAAASQDLELPELDTGTQEET
jgi:hypothetical protein